MSNAEGTDPDIQTRPIQPPERREVPDDAELDALEDDRDPEELADDRGPLPDAALDHAVLPDDRRDADEGYADAPEADADVDDDER
ncbi:hypothetical protein N8K70_04860 [Microbacterium betulae]|uniref:Uncharacterized protein n=1 Tax=Microbacterium betulae TaxID=2981139 RepID=A0AA97I795_9MICO|nr:hypothetical protein [Microbacterium sp. AB]WOF24012.1 hypothetical protein N8K70_04860 [Microbacterium sp. AB]